MSQFETIGGLDSIEMSPSLRDSLQRAISYAYEQSHRQVTLEHLLLALVEDRDAAVILEASSISVAALMTDVSAYLGQLDDRVGDGQLRRPELGRDVRHIVQSAGAAAQKSKRRAVSSALVLAAVVGDGRSPAAQILRKHGLTFENAITALKQANAASGTRPEPKPAVESPDTAPGAQEASAAPAATKPTAPVPTPTLASGPVAMPVNPPPPGSGSAARLQNMQAAHEIIAGARERIAAARGAIATRSSEQQEPPAPPPPNVPTPAYAGQASDVTLATQPPTQPPATAVPSRPAPRPMEVNGRATAAPSGVASEYVTAPTTGLPEASPPPHNASSTPPAATDRPPGGGAENPGLKPAPRPKLAPPPPAFEQAPPSGRAAPPASGGPPPAPIVTRPPAAPTMPDGQSAPPPLDRSPLPTAPATDPPWRAQPDMPLPRTPAGRGMPRGPGPHANGQPSPAAIPTSPPGGLPGGSSGGLSGALSGGPQGIAAPMQRSSRPAAAEEPPLFPHPPVQPPASPAGGGGALPTHAPLPRPSPMHAPLPVLQGQVAPEVTPIEPELLTEGMPTRMRVGTPTTIEIRAPRARLEAWSGGSLDPRARDDRIIMKAMVMRLKAPEGGFTVEAASPETQWSEGYTGPLSDDVVSWRWVVTPSASGRLPLQLSVATRVVGRDGLAAARVLPEQLVSVRVAPDFGRIASRLAVSLTLLVSGLIVGYFADSLFSIGSSVLALQ